MLISQFTIYSLNIVGIRLEVFFFFFFGGGGGGGIAPQEK